MSNIVNHLNTKNTYAIYLIANTLGSDFVYALPALVQDIVRDSKYFIVENAKNARAFIKSINPEVKVSEMIIWELDPVGLLSDDAMKQLPKVLLDNNVIVLSDAGMPCIADPGASVVRWAHENNIQVVPCVGPSALLLALCASGLNGQSFQFHGYLPIKTGDRTKYLSQIEKDIYMTGTTQIFIETPYRNQAMLSDILMTCKYSTMLTVALSVTSPREWIKTKSIDMWQRQDIELSRDPAMFLLGK